MRPPSEGSPTCIPSAIASQSGSLAGLPPSFRASNTQVAPAGTSASHWNSTVLTGTCGSVRRLPTPENWIFAATKDPVSIFIRGTGFATPPTGSRR